MPNSQKRVTIVHTSFVIFDELEKLFDELAPDIELHHIVDDSLLPEILAVGQVTPTAQERLNLYFKAAEIAGADLIVSQCSTVGEAAEVSAQGVNIPVLKIDTRMAEIACQSGKRVGVVATVNTTLGPTSRLIEKTARRLNQDVEVEACLVPGAWEALHEGDREKHNQLILDSIRSLMQRVEVVVCAQGSMASIIPQLGDTPVPVLTSLRSGVESVAEFVNA